MYRSFISKYSIFQRLNCDRRTSENVIISKYLQGLEPLQGCSFYSGIYRVHCFSEVEKWTSIVIEAFPEFKDRVYCFASEWGGSQFAIDLERINDGEPQLLLFEPGTGQVLEIPLSINDFHNQELITDPDPALSIQFFESWIGMGGETPNANECIGYNNLLFLGGSDTIDNLQKIDMEVYWSICGQLLSRAKNLNVGDKIGEIEIN